MRIVRWVLVCVALAAVVYAFAVSAWVFTGRDCPLGMEFERTGSQVLYSRPLPPRVVCRYEYLSGLNGTELYPPTTETLDATGPWIAALACTALAIGVLVVSRRSQAGRDQSTPNGIADA